MTLPASAGAYVYWGMHNSNSLLGRANLDGSAQNLNFVADLEGEAGNVDSVAVDGSHVYWIDSDRNTIGRANLDGSEPNLNFVHGAQAVSGITISGPYIYWSTDSSIGRAKLDGGEVNTEFVGNGSGTGEGTDQVAVDSNRIFWTNKALKYIGSATIEGEEIEKPIFVGSEYLSGIVASSDGLFFDNGNKGIGFVNLTGHFIIEDAIPNAFGQALAINGEYIYWSTFKGIGRAHLDGTELNQTFITPATGGALGVAADSAAPGAAQAPVANPPSPLGPPPPPDPANTFILGKAKSLVKSGGATLALTLPGPGKLVLKGKGLITLTKVVMAKGSFSVAIKPTKKTAAKLKKAGKVKVTAEITFTPTGGTPHTESKALTLKS